MKIRFEIELPEPIIEENPLEPYWQRYSDEDIEVAIVEGIVCDIEFMARVKLNQDDLKEFIKQVRDNTKETN